METKFTNETLRFLGFLSIGFYDFILTGESIPRAFVDEQRNEEQYCCTYQGPDNWVSVWFWDVNNNNIWDDFNITTGKGQRKAKHIEKNC